MQRQLDVLDLKYQFVEAIDKYDLKSKKYRTAIAEQLDIDKTCLESLYHTYHSIGALAVTLSHIKVYNLIIQNNIPYACVLEDDAHILPAFPKVLAIAPKVPWDILMLSNQTDFIRNTLYKFRFFRFHAFCKLICYKRYYPQLNLLIVRLLAFEILKFPLFRLQNRILKRIHSSRSSENEGRLKLRPSAKVSAASLKIGGIPNNNRRFWHKVACKHYIVAPHDGIFNITSGTAYMLTRSAAIKWKKAALLARSGFDAIDTEPLMLHRKKCLTLRMIHPPCIRVAYQYIVNSLS